MADLEKQPLQESTKKDKPADSAEPKSSGRRVGLILKIVAAVIAVVVLGNLIFWGIINPRKMKFYVTDATLTEFYLTDDNDLHYNLRLNLTVRNPNKRIGFQYDAVEGGASYGGEKFDSGNLLSFYQPPKTTTVVDAWFSGVKRLSLGFDEVKEFSEQKSSGVYPVDVKIRVYSSIKLGKIHVGEFKVKVKCGLKIPLTASTSSDGEYSLGITTGAGFRATQCHVDFNPLIVIYSD
ncbi:hypothetical protein TIFTF001_008770 [Ficus carica]|uniref:Late embryogenesis abundant protein LEA-2 subgroup domain-containing protein n=1 Tax=Ficus carica TaxID=3494 RepID=A0AA87ZNN6_FICCA|nr:hypothetical protein TIFTF001_008770 [Ficus carica]